MRLCTGITMLMVLPWENNETRNYMRMIVIAQDIVRKGLREVFKQEWDTRYQASFGAWDDTSVSGQQLYNREKIRPGARNYLTLFQNGDTSEWDCTVLFDAILQSKSIGKVNLNPKIKTEVDNLRKVRNSFMHVTEQKLTDGEFQNMVTRVENSLKILGLSTNELQQIVNEKNRYQSFQARPSTPMHDNAELPKKKRTEHGNDRTVNVLELELKKSVKHREKIQILRSIDDEKLAKVKPPLRYFSPDVKTKLGSGSDGTLVYVSILEDESEVAVKRIQIDSTDDTAENEKKILSFINTKKSPFIVHYRQFFRDDTFMYLILDLCEETLKDFVQSQTIEHLQQHGPRMIKQIVAGLQFLHGQRILHRDLKPLNVLVDLGGHMRLADFGISRTLNENETTHYTDPNGTVGWMAAEVIEAIKQKTAGGYKTKSDVQVAGMIAYFILTKGKHPYGEPLDRMKNIVDGNPVNLEKLDDPDARRFVSWLISHNIEDRPFADEALKHSFLDGVKIVFETGM